MKKPRSLSGSCMTPMTHSAAGITAAPGRNAAVGLDIRIFTLPIELRRGP